MLTEALPTRPEDAMCKPEAELAKSRASRRSIAEATSPMAERATEKILSTRSEGVSRSLLEFSKVS
jgi:hypothetical protein